MERVLNPVVGQSKALHLERRAGTNDRSARVPGG